ncbi:acyltransferase family protein [Clavibacter sp. VKM Ac-2873]|uniref:acyltransferase family protein n=1 Tax=Clavibacter sp. VKM Ac-2873 TaxID=2783813 RepID=UPI00188AFF30|nr:acyltransferase family protein [Clavibacter sp. VKM Ac-2873]MBF4617467.1 acyltransferase family protein [Clavibacter sp. VKM Ac-2873]
MALPSMRPRARARANPVIRPAPAAAATAADRPRFEWIDAGKGACMVLVVLLHLSLMYENEVNEGAAALWWDVSSAFAPLRMPLFFFISGFLAMRAVERPLGQTRGRTLGISSVYAIWTLLFLARLFVPQARGGGAAPTPGELALSLVLPTSYWYLWALPVFFLVAWACTRLLGDRRAWALIPFAALAAAAPLLKPLTAGLLTEPMDAVKLSSIAANLVWFYAGVVGRDAWLSLMRRATRLSAVVAVLAYVGVFAALRATGNGLILTFAIAAVALVASNQVLAVVGMANPLARALRWVGRQTLPVYVFHIFIVSALSAALKATGVVPALQQHTQLWGAILPIALLVPVVVASRIIGAAVLGSRLRWMLEGPRWLTAGRAPAAADAARS